MKGAMTKIIEKYSEERINVLYRLLKNVMKKGRPKEFDLRIDDFKVISRTSDPEDLLAHKEFIIPETKNIKVNIYEGSCNRRIQYIFILKEEAPVSPQTLSGTGDNKLEKFDEERNNKYNKEIDQLKKRLAETAGRINGVEENFKNAVLKNAFLEMVVDYLMPWYLNNKAAEKVHK